jgi:hypothetical protein
MRLVEMLDRPYEDFRGWVKAVDLVPSPADRQAAACQGMVDIAVNVDTSTGAPTLQNQVPG